MTTIKQTVIFISLLLISSLFVYSSLYWTSVTAVSNEELLDVRLGFPLPFESFDYYGKYNDPTTPLFKLPAEIGIHHPFNATTFLPVPFLINLLIIQTFLCLLVKYRYRTPVKGLLLFIGIFTLLKLFVIPLMSMIGRVDVDVRQGLSHPVQVNENQWKPVEVSP